MNETKNLTPELEEKLNYCYQERKILDSIREIPDEAEAHHYGEITPEEKKEARIERLKELQVKEAVLRTPIELAEDYECLSTYYFEVMEELDALIISLEMRIAHDRDCVACMRTNELYTLTSKEEYAEDDIHFYRDMQTLYKEDIPMSYKVLNCAYNALNEFKKLEKELEYYEN